MKLTRFRIILLATLATVAFCLAVNAEQQHQFATKFWGDEANDTYNGNGKSLNGEGVAIALYVDAAPSPWHSLTMEEKIASTLTRSSDLRIASISAEREQPEAISFTKHIEEILSHAELLGARYAVIVTTGSPRLETKKSLHVPLVFHMYQAKGIVDGELRIFDLSRKRQLAAEPFTVSKEGPRALQATMDDDVNDPDLHVAAPQKLKFFDDLEQDAADHIAKRVRKLARGR